jgi:hypothetical protein
MAALSAETARESRNDHMKRKRRFLMTASKTIYKGGFVAIIATTGLAEAAADTSGFRSVGIATETVTSAASGSYYITVEYGHEVKVACASTMVGAVDVAVCISTDNDVEVIATTTNDVKAGIVREAVSTTVVWLEVCGSTNL